MPDNAAAPSAPPAPAPGEPLAAARHAYAMLRSPARTEQDVTAAWDTLDAVLGSVGQSPRKDVETVYPRDEYHEDEGPVLWWAVPVQEPPYVGTLTASDFPDYATHWSRLHIPESLLSTAARASRPTEETDDAR